MGRAARAWHHRRCEQTDGVSVPRSNDLSRSLAALDQDIMLIAVIEISQSSWLVAAIVPGIARHPVKELAPDATALVDLPHRWRAEAARKAGCTITRIAVAPGLRRGRLSRPVATASGWPVGWGRAASKACVIHPNSVAVSREHRRAKTDRLDTALLKRGLSRLAARRARPLPDDCDPDPGGGRRQATGPRARRAGRRAHPHHQPLQEYLGVARHPRFQTDTCAMRRHGSRQLRTHEGMPLPANTMAELQREMARLRAGRRADPGDRDRAPANG